MKTTTKSFLTLAAVGWLSCWSLPGAVLTYTNVKTFTTGEYGTFNLQQFDESLGTLTSVTFQLSLAVTGGTVDFTSTGLQTGSRRLGLSTTVDLTSGSVGSLTVTTSASAYQDYLNILTGTNLTYTEGSVTGFSSQTLSSALTPFLGTDVLTYSFDSYATPITSVVPGHSPSSTGVTQEHPGGGTMTTMLSYNYIAYTVVPEPTPSQIMALTAVGFLMLTFRKRRRY
jgi:hypothetical protein